MSVARLAHPRRLRRIGGERRDERQRHRRARRPRFSGSSVPAERRGCPSRRIRAARRGASADDAGSSPARADRRRARAVPASAADRCGRSGSAQRRRRRHPRDRRAASRALAGRWHRTDRRARSPAADRPTRRTGWSAPVATQRPAAAATNARIAATCCVRQRPDVRQDQHRQACRRALDVVDVDRQVRNPRADQRVHESGVRRVDAVRGVVAAEEVGVALRPHARRRSRPACDRRGTARSPCHQRITGSGVLYIRRSS